MKILSEKIKLYAGTYSAGTGSSKTFQAYDWCSEGIPDIVSLPAMGAAPEKVEVTTLGSDTRLYINGLKDYGDLEFGFVYDVDKKYKSASSVTDNDQDLYEKLESLKNAKDVCWKVAFPGIQGGVLTEDAGTNFYFKGRPAVALSAAEVGARVDFTMTVGLETAISTSEDILDN